MSDRPQNAQLEAFLAADQTAAAPPPAAPPEQPTQATEPEPAAEPKQRATEAKPKAETPAAEPPADDDPDDGSGTVPIAAFRKAREDYKTRAARAEAAAEELRAQLAAMRQPQPPPQQEQQRARLPPPDPARDPQGYHVWVQTERINDKLDLSEAMLRRALGHDAVNEVQKDFRTAAEADPTLWAKLYAQPDPYDWAHKQVQQQRAVKEIGTDPDAYRTKLRAEIEAQLRAELGAGQGGPQQPPPSPAAGLPPSLATVRSSAPRGQTFSGAPAIEDVVGRRSGDLFVRQR